MADTCPPINDSPHDRDIPKQPLATVQAAGFSDPTIHTNKFSQGWRLHVVVTGLTCGFNGALGTSMPSGALDAISKHFGVYDPLQLTLLNSLNLVGFVIGPLFFGPLSEYIGRRPVMVFTFLGYLVFMLACSGAPNYTALLVFRLLCGVNAAAPMAVIGGLYSDVLTLPETFAPVIHNREIKKRQEHGESLEEAHMTDLHPFDAREIFLRPVTLMISQPILSLSSLYLTLVNALLYLSFQAYPLVFEGTYGLSTGIAGLAYLPTLGVLIAFIGFIVYTRWYDRSRTRGEPWAQREVNRRLPIACLAAPCIVISLFWFGWASQPSVSPFVPAFAGFFFGVGFQLIFMSILNYITDVYRKASASAHAGAGCMRSIGAIAIPLGAGSMYDRLGVQWAQSLLGFLALAMGVIPFIFMRYSDRLAERSKRSQTI